MAETNNILEVKNLSIQFGGLRAGIEARGGKARG